MCALGRTIFVNRNEIRKVKGQMNRITTSLKNGYSVILFPEGTSSDGSKVLPFKTSLLGVIEDKKSGEYRLSHHLDLKTGFYKGRQVLDPKE